MNSIHNFIVDAIQCQHAEGVFMRFLSYLFSKNPHSFCILGRLEKQMIPSFVVCVVSKNLHSQGVKLGKQTY